MNVLQQVWRARRYLSIYFLQIVINNHDENNNNTKTMHATSDMFKTRVAGRAVRLSPARPLKS